MIKLSAAKSRSLFLCSLACFGASVPSAADIPRSVAERSEYRRTATEEEIAELLEAAEQSDPRMSRSVLGMSTEDRRIQMLKIDFKDSSETDERLTAVIIGGIHSGECAGKEALYDLIREIADGQHDDWFSGLRIVLIPSLSPDSNVRRAVDNRPGQIGPVEGMGQRQNAQGLDLNRDFLKLETPEIRSLVKLFNEVDADLLIDLHTTNGSQHRYDLTYDPPHHPLTPTSIRSFLRQDLLPTLTENVAENGFSMFYYGNFDRSHSRWSTYGYEGRYSTNYMGLRGKLAILSEAYSYATYQRRIEASHALMVGSLDYISDNLTAARESIDKAAVPVVGQEVAMTADLVAFDEQVFIKGYKPNPATEGQSREDFDYEVSFYGTYIPRRSADLPTSYFVPSSETAVIELLDRHGIKYQPASIDSQKVLKVYEITKCDIATQPFQGHRMVSLEGDWRELEISTDQAGISVSTQQPLAAVIAVLLQPESSDSVATWNIIPAERLQPGTKFPVYKLQ